MDRTNNNSSYIQTLELTADELCRLMSFLNDSQSGHYLAEGIMDELCKCSSVSFIDMELSMQAELAEALRENLTPFVRVSTDGISVIICEAKSDYIFIIRKADIERVENIINELELSCNEYASSSKTTEVLQDDSENITYAASNNLSNDLEMSPDGTEPTDIKHKVKKTPPAGIYSLGTLSSVIRDSNNTYIDNIYTKPEQTNSPVIAIRSGLNGRTRENNANKEHTSSASPLFKKYSDHVIRRSTPTHPYVSKVSGYARMLAMSSILPQDTEGGRGAQMVIGVASPIGSYMQARFIQKSITAINRDIDFDKTTYLNAYAVYSYNTQVHHPDKYTDPEEIIAKVYSVSANGRPDMNEAGRVFSQTAYPSFAHMIRFMDAKNMDCFFKAQRISNDLSNAITKYGLSRLRTPSGLLKLMPFITSSEDRHFIEMLRSSQLSDIYHSSPITSLIRSFSKRAAMRGIGRSEGAMGIRKLMGMERTMRTAYKLGLKMAAGISEKKLGATHILTKSLRFARSPVKHIINHTFRISKFASTAQKGKLLLKARKLLNFRLFAHTATAKTVEATATATGAATASAVAAGSTSAGAAASAGSTGAGAGASAGAGAGATGGISVGAVIAIVVIIIILVAYSIELINKNSESTEYKPQSPSIYADNTEMVQEIIIELEGYNTSFNQQINDARHHRGAYAMSEGFKDAESANEYEEGAYAVIFRDGYGNELDPKTVDFNNTKAILAMASTYFPYPFSSLPEGATKKQREMYEQKKQYFFDYCRYLWISTHRIDIEEYYPGDNKYSEIDDSSMITDNGVCGMNGKRIWLPEDMEPDCVDTIVCPYCDTDFATGNGLNSHALCGHPDETFISSDGWRKTGNTVVHYNCPNGHKHGSWVKDEGGWTDNTYFTYCEEGNVENPKHRHVSYEWEYVCGGHMGAVVYVTIGNTSRLNSMPAAGDIDYGAVASYKED